MLDLLYSQLARARRRYYQRHPHLRRRLAQPVISVGNLSVGGSGKTPLSAEIARMLVDMGERPSILSRGYARQILEDGVVVVSDGQSILADEAHSGDEPQLLAKRVPGAAVLVCSSRYLSGCLAERRLGCTVHVLDDGFQHFDLMRDVDLLVAPDALDSVRTLPSGRLREPLDAASAADALLVEVASLAAGPELQDPIGMTSVASRLNVPISFEFSRRLGTTAEPSPAFAFAGIAKPERFYGDLEKAGWHLTGRRSFRDHHRYSTDDLREVARAAKESGAHMMVTTEKDQVRLPPQEGELPIVAIPLEIAIASSFKPWLEGRLRAVRSGNPA